MAVWERTVNGYVISTDPSKLDPDVIWTYLCRESEWASGIPYETVMRTLRHSLNFGLYAPSGAQVGFARVVTDYGQFAYLCDVFVLPAHRGRGLGRALVRSVMAHPDLKNLRRIALDAARPARSLYLQFGFRPLRDPECHLERVRRAEELWGGSGGDGPTPPGRSTATGTPPKAGRHRRPAVARSNLTRRPP
jgi:ribosomal protein S18 acetylase RimI-like enzyme